MMKIIAHRGASAYKPENTISAFKEAIRMKADGIECDVRLTADKKLAVIHDATIDRTTSGKGKVNEYTSKQLKKYGIPGLKEAINMIKKTELMMFIEMKEKGAEKQIADVIRKNNIEDRAIVVSFYADSISKVKNLSKTNKIQTGLIFSKLNDSFKTAISSKADWLIPCFNLVTKELIEKAHKSDMKVLAWTVDDAKIAKMLPVLTDAIATNKPDILHNKI